MFLFLAFFFAMEEPLRDYRMTPTVALRALPYDVARLAPWAADYTSRHPAGFASTGLDAPNPSDFTTSATIQLAASDAEVQELQRENEDLRKRLNDIEQMMKQKLSEPPTAAPQPDMQVTNGMKSIPGWRAELYDWNKQGILAADPKRTVLTQSCPFNGTFGHTTANEMSIYRFLGVFRAKEQGRYVFALDTKCEFGHRCHASMSVDGGEILKFDGQTDYSRLLNGVPLSPGDHALEFRIWLKSNSFLKYKPAESFQFQPLVKTAADLNPRSFAADELFTVVPATVTQSVQGCTY